MHKLIKKLWQYIASKRECYKADQVYWVVVQEGPPPSYYLKHTKEELQRERKAALATIDRLIAEDSRNNV